MMAPFETEPPPAHPTGKRRRRSSIFIAAFVAAQFLIPLSYLAREDASDDRFTWRSFARPPIESCESLASLQLYGGERHQVRVEELLHADWVRYVQEGRLVVVDAFLLKQCEADDVERVDLVNRCDDERRTRSFSLRCGGERSHETTRTAAR
jgi:hypothetical protein